MKTVLLLGLILLAARDAVAVRAITHDEDLKIQDQLGEASKINFELQGKRSDLEKAHRQGKDVQGLVDEIKKLESSRVRAYNKAIWMAIEYYEIIPPDSPLPQGKIVRESPNKGQIVTWIPMFDDHSDHNMVDAKGNYIGKDKLWEAGGIASSDGISRIFPEHFISPAELAATIIHEKQHFDQFTTRGVGDVMTPGELELPAVDVELALQKNGTLGIPGWRLPMWLKDHNSYRSEKEKQGKAERELFNRTGYMTTSNYPEPLAAKELARIKREAEGLRESVAYRAALEQLGGIAGSICRSPGAIWSDAMTAGYEKACQALQGADLPYSLGDFLGIAGCELHTLTVMVPCTDATDAQARARRAAQPPPARMVPPSVPPKLIPAPAPIPPAERETDRKTLTRLYQQMVDVCDKLCRDPSDAWTQYDVLCDDRRQVGEIAGKYARAGDTVPDDFWSDVRSAPCGWEFWREIRDDAEGMCFGADAATETQWARWFQGTAGGLNRKYHPAAPPSTPTFPPRAPNPSPGGGSRGGGSGGCPPGCQDNGPGRTCSCPVPP